MNTRDAFQAAFETRDIREFMGIVFPPHWAPIAARIIESGGAIVDEMCPWAPRWSSIPPTVRGTPDDPLDMMVRSVLFRAHDCLHQLWGVPVPGASFTKDDFYLFVRALLCGEVAVLTLTEFVLAKHIYEQHPDVRRVICQRDAVQMLDGPLRGRTVAQIAQRMDTVLHKGKRPEWLRGNTNAGLFADYYVPMLEQDRRCARHNFALMKRAGWRPVGAPNSRYSPIMDGLELTQWMIRDFEHLLDTDPEVDEPLAAFNQERRASIVLPSGWNEPGGGPHAACMVVQDDQGRVLLAARRDAYDDMGLLGGGIDPGEAPLCAAVREAYEEARVVVDEAVKVYEADGVVTYRASRWHREPGDGDCQVRWGTWDEACAGSFGPYNAKVRQAVGA